MACYEAEQTVDKSSLAPVGVGADPGAAVPVDSLSSVVEPESGARSPESPDAAEALGVASLSDASIVRSTVLRITWGS